MNKRKPKTRNPVALSPLLRKGGAHVRSKTGLRHSAKLSTADAVDDWLDELEEQKNGEQTLPDLFPYPLNRYSPISLAMLTTPARLLTSNLR